MLHPVCIALCFLAIDGSVEVIEWQDISWDYILYAQGRRNEAGSLICYTYLIPEKIDYKILLLRDQASLT